MNCLLAVIFALCIIACAFADATDSGKGELSEYKATCIAETGASEAVIEKVRRGYPVQFDDKLNCFAACMLKKIGIMRQDGTIDAEVARNNVPKDIPKQRSDQIIKICKAQVGKTDCMTGGKVLACFMKTKAITLV